MFGPSSLHAEAGPARWLSGLVLASVVGLAGLQAWLDCAGDGVARDEAAICVIARRPSDPGDAAARRAAQRVPRFVRHESVAALPATPAPARVEGATAASWRDDDAPTVIELEHELTALRVENALLAARIVDLEREKAELEADAGRDLMGIEMHRALRRDFADVATGSIEAGGRSWELEDELGDILERCAGALQPREITDPVTGLTRPNPDVLDWPALRAAVGDGRIRSVGQALPRLLPELALAPSIDQSWSCGGSTSSHDITVHFHAIEDGHVVITSSIHVKDDDDPLLVRARRDAEEAEMRCRRTVESLVGLRLYDEDE